MSRKSEFRRVGRRQDVRRYQANRARAAQQEVIEHRFVRKTRVVTNWRVHRTKDGDIVAVEPNREFESVFDGGKDPFMEALEYAAKKIREGK